MGTVNHTDTQGDVDVTEDMRIPMRDGVTLSARVWMPKAANAVPVPAILEILPYRKRDGTDARDASTHAVFARHGYVCLRVDLRGCGESEGLFDDEYSETELGDIEDTIAWIVAQPWCSGAVGIMGISWGGFNGLQVAARRPAGLKAVISLCSGVDRFADDIHYKGGCQLTENVGWATVAMSWFSVPPDPDLVGPAWRDIWLDRLENTPFLISPWLAHDRRDAYWRHASVCEDYAAMDAAILSIGGWHDGYRNTPVKLLEGGTPGVVKAIMGPWNHKYPHLASPAPRMDFIAVALEWWDRWLKDVPNGVEDGPDYRVYLMDGIAPQTSYETRPGRWIALPSWPSPLIGTRTLVLGDRMLGQGPASSPMQVRTEAVCGKATGEFFPFGFGPGELPDDQRSDDALSLCFDTEALDRDTALVGAPSVQLSVSADRPFGQVAARLCDVAPDGASTLISLGFLNLQFRDGFADPVPLVPGRICQVTIDLDQAAYVVPGGHRLRLAISPSYWPFVWPEPGAVCLTVSQGTLTVPVLTTEAAPDWSCPAPAAPPPSVLRATREGYAEKIETVEDGWLKTTILADHGEVAHIEHGLRTSSAVREVWSIDQADVSRARADIRWDRAMSRGGFAVSTSVETTLHSDATAFHVSTRLRAYEGAHCIFEREYHDRINRMPGSDPRP
ncbi:CocE/NonD family hydrolase [Roseivivax sp. CAU 1753]